ncbi:hypothetical protein AMES_7957 [Amycolatopsis mediterranei S699]|uniref:DUF2382 domain-containing protein n=2 Tax=Amycolatopsis mediterranei TaxID=33910 RepID=A0A0H3DHW7_AMYMU|nr:PRC and DUF2382 domain-containing protein [Amycolatopsis mediterranei]ADJ49782.1 conserved hypothetical protein [Amycolatopsis mediterranei U32]AEK46768.1 hypothetical protein RAM_41505 [Amycolatopsis mediterranei S699]AFO81490.1 hypothetical protein AMES_7957 [Amycolatopsis mediterranei S699]AGT88619.1 hypothetical protein B737_7958 [Amycolatopsis mediterranei RB]KDU93134.1 hypothetical protein DV36_03590 [Amycolatopsis mediterranei]
MARTMQLEELIDSAVVDPDGNKIGKVGNVYLADATHQPEWITVKTGLFGTKESFVPLSGARTDKDGIHVQVDKDSVSEAPRIDADGHLSPEESTQLYQHYGLPVPRTSSDGRPDGRMDRGPAVPGGRGKRDDRAAMTRSEERLNVGTEQVETGHVRLRKYVVTEEQQVTVPVRHEEVRVEREPITRADGTAEIGEAEQDVILHAEKPVVRKETVPVERARLRTETVSDEQTVSGKVRKEQFEVTDDDRKHRRS